MNVKPLLIVIGTLLSASTIFAADIQVKHTFSNTISAERITRLVVDVPVGEIAIRTAPGREIRVDGVAVREAGHQREVAAAQRIADASSVVVKSRGRIAYIEPQYRENARGWIKRKNTRFRITVTLPADLPVDVDQEVGELSISGLTSDLNVRLGVGEVAVALPRKMVRELSASATVGEVKTNFSDRTITKEGFFAGTTHFVNEGGRATVTLRVRVGEMKIDLLD